MTKLVRLRRRNLVDEPLAVLVAVAGALVAVGSGATPTGSPAWDAIYVFAASAVTIWASASAPWWAGAVACGIGASIALDPIVAMLGAIGFIAGLVVGVQQR